MASPRSGWTTRIQNSSGTTLSGTPIIALHGFTGRGTDWAPLRERMRGHAWLTPDMPGHGPSPVLPATLAEHQTMIARALAFFTEAPVLIGYSMGARLAMHLALARTGDFSALVLIGGTPGIQNPDERAARAVADAERARNIRNSDIASFLSEWDAQPLFSGKAGIPEPHKSRSLSARLQNTPNGLAASLEDCGAGALPSLWDRLSEFTIPVLLVTGENDQKFSGIADRIVSCSPGFDSASIPQAGHVTHLERPEATAAVIETWLSRQSGTDR